MRDEKQPIFSLYGGLQATMASASDRLHAAARKVIRESDQKQGDGFGDSVGVGGSHLSEALSGRGLKHFSLRWVPQLLVLDRKHHFLETAAALVDMRLVPKRPRSAAQKLAMLRAELRDGGADVDALEARAYARQWDDDEESPR